MDDKFRNFGNSINRLIAGEDLSREETKRLFSEILNGEQTDIHQGAFIAAITAKGPSPQEIAGAWEAIFDLDTVKASPDVKKELVDNCGTGMDDFKTFNISTGAAVVAAAGGVCVARHGSRAITSSCGTVDLCEALGIDVECSIKTVKKSIEKTGIGLFNGMSSKVHPKALFRILSQTCFGSILNIAASLANPAGPSYGVRGVYSKEMVNKVILTMKEIGFKKAMVFYGSSKNGSGGMDELSPVSDSFVAELSENGEIKNYTFSPKEAGLLYQPALEELAGGDVPHKEALRLIKIFSRGDKKGLYETVCLNAAPIFYVSGDVGSLKEGVAKARDIIDSGRAMLKLREWIHVQNEESGAGDRRFETLINEL